MQKKAWIISADMGYGHQRAAYPLKDIAFERIITANSDKVITPKEKKKWEKTRRFYEGVSRLTRIPVIGKFIFNLYDKLQNISPFYPFRDLSKPTYALSYLMHHIKKGFCRSIIHHAKKKNIPFVTTFIFPALAADYHNLKNIYAVVTDVDINRIWVSKNPKKSKIHYFAPARHTVKRLKQYGVPENKIFLTGFPLPKENLGGENLHILKRDLGNRLPNLDPNRIYIHRYKDHIKKHLGKNKLKKKSDHLLTITFMVGGAGAQKEIGVQILKSLKQKIRKGKIIINLVAGTHLEISEYYRKAVQNLGLKKYLDKNINIIFGMSKKEYFERFNQALHKTDILWTKPSELSFYTALGLPIIIAPPLGAHEHYNKKWLLHLGAGFEQEDPRYVNDWLYDWLDSGRLAECAWEGFLETPKYGTYNIERLIFAKDKKKVRLMH